MNAKNRRIITKALKADPRLADHLKHSAADLQERKIYIALTQIFSDAYPSEQSGDAALATATATRTLFNAEASAYRLNAHDFVTTLLFA